MKLTLNKDELVEGDDKLTNLDDIDDLLKTIAEVWLWGPKKGCKQPNLLISVTGGAWDFPINSRVDEVFRKGIVEAAVSASM